MPPPVAKKKTSSLLGKAVRVLKTVNKGASYLSPLGPLMHNKKALEVLGYPAATVDRALGAVDLGVNNLLGWGDQVANHDPNASFVERNFPGLFTEQFGRSFKGDRIPIHWATPNLMPLSGGAGGAPLAVTAPSAHGDLRLDNPVVTGLVGFGGRALIDPLNYVAGAGAVDELGNITRVPRNVELARKAQELTTAGEVASGTSAKIVNSGLSKLTKQEKDALGVVDSLILKLPGRNGIVIPGTETASLASQHAFGQVRSGLTELRDARFLEKHPDMSPLADTSNVPGAGARKLQSGRYKIGLRRSATADLKSIIEDPSGAVDNVARLFNVENIKRTVTLRRPRLQDLALRMPGEGALVDLTPELPFEARGAVQAAGGLHVIADKKIPVPELSFLQSQLDTWGQQIVTESKIALSPDMETGFRAGVTANARAVGAKLAGAADLSPASVKAEYLAFSERVTSTLAEKAASAKYATEAQGIAQGSQAQKIIDQYAPRAKAADKAVEAAKLQSKAGRQAVVSTKAEAKQALDDLKALGAKARAEIKAIDVTPPKPPKVTPPPSLEAFMTARGMDVRNPGVVKDFEGNLTRQTVPGKGSAVRQALEEPLGKTPKAIDAQVKKALDELGQRLAAGDPAPEIAARQQVLSLYSQTREWNAVLDKIPAEVKVDQVLAQHRLDLMSALTSPTAPKNQAVIKRVIQEGQIYPEIKQATENLATFIDNYNAAKSGRTLAAQGRIYQKAAGKQAVEALKQAEDAAIAQLTTIYHIENQRTDALLKDAQRVSGVSLSDTKNMAAKVFRATYKATPEARQAAMEAVDRSYRIWYADNHFLTPAETDYIRGSGQPLKGAEKYWAEVTSMWKATRLAGISFNDNNYRGGFINNLLEGVTPFWHKLAANWEVPMRDALGTHGDIHLAIDTAWVRARGGGLLPKNILEEDFKDALFSATGLDQLGDGFEAAHAAVAGGRLEESVGKIETYSRWLEQHATPTKNMILGPRLGMKTGVESNLRLSSYTWAREQGLSHEAALDRMFASHIDYTDISNADRFVSSNLMPFWTFRSRNMGMMVEQMLRNPTASRALVQSRIANDHGDASLPPGYGGLYAPLGGGRILSLPGLNISDPLQMADQIAGGRKGVSDLLTQSVGGPIFSALKAAQDISARSTRGYGENVARELGGRPVTDVLNVGHLSGIYDATANVVDPGREQLAHTPSQADVNWLSGFLAAVGEPAYRDYGVKGQKKAKPPTAIPYKRPTYKIPK